jgi:hypothetical protein
VEFSFVQLLRVGQAKSPQSSRLVESPRWVPLTVAYDEICWGVFLASRSFDMLRCVEHADNLSFLRGIPVLYKVVHVLVVHAPSNSERAFSTVF